MSGSAGASLPWANPQKEGYLNKRGHVVRNWKKRWFRLKNDMLYYFKDPDAQPVGEVPLKRSEVAPTNKVNKPFCFELNSREIEKVCSNGTHAHTEPPFDSKQHSHTHIKTLCSTDLLYPGRER